MNQAAVAIFSGPSGAARTREKKQALKLSLIEAEHTNLLSTMQHTQHAKTNMHCGHKIQLKNVSFILFKAIVFLKAIP